MYQDLIKNYYYYGCFDKQILPLILFSPFTATEYQLLT